MTIRTSGLASGTVLYGIGGVLARGLNLLFLPILTAYLSAAAYGEVALVSQVTFLLTSIFSLGGGAALGIVYFSREDYIWKSSVLWSAFLLLSMSSAVVLCMGCLVGIVVGPHMAISDGTILIEIATLGSCLQILSIPLSLFLQFEKRAITFVIIDTIFTASALGLSLLLVVILRWGAIGMMVGMLVAQMVNLLALLIIALHATNFRIAAAHIREVASTGIPLVPSFVILFVLGQSSRFLLGWMHGAQAVGIYSLGYNFGVLMTIAVGGFTSAWTVHFLGYTGRYDEARIEFPRVMTFYVYGFGTLTLFFFVLAKPVVMIFASHAFRDAYQVVGLAATSQFFIGIHSIFLTGPYLAKDVKAMVIVQAIASVISIGVGWVIVGQFGVIGAGIALTLSYLSMALLQYVWNYSKGQEYLTIEYEWGRLIKFGIVGCVIATFTLATRPTSVAHEVLISSLLFVLLVISVVFLLKPNERESLMSLIKGRSLKGLTRVTNVSVDDMKEG